MILSMRGSMLLIKTEVKQSLIPNAGLGLFTCEDLVKGQMIWKDNPKIDIRFDSFDDLGLQGHARELIESFSWFDKDHNIWILPCDNARYFNHSEHPNCEAYFENYVYANEDIKAGSELTEDYRVFHTGELW